MKVLIGILLLLGLSGCGKVDRVMAAWTGDATETCQSGVIYLQFTSGVSVKYNKDGSIATCGN